MGNPCRRGCTDSSLFGSLWAHRVSWDERSNQDRSNPNSSVPCRRSLQLCFRCSGLARRLIAGPRADRHILPHSAHFLSLRGTRSLTRTNLVWYGNPPVAKIGSAFILISVGSLLLDTRREGLCSRCKNTLDLLRHAMPSEKSGYDQVHHQ